MSDVRPTAKRPEFRLLPQPTLGSAPFWAAGADDVLHIVRCGSCGAYTHPPLPLCRVCRSDDMTLSPVSGRAVVVGVTVNHQQWHPKIPPPYVIAVVALEEDAGVRLTTNIVGCEPGDVHIGQAVRVVFEHHDDVHLPLFEPDPERVGQLLATPEDPDLSGFVRPRVSATKYEDKVAFTGVGQSRVGRRLLVDPVSLAVEASLAAIEDAGLTLDDIDGLSTWPGRSGPPGMSEGGIPPMVEALQLRPTWINGVGDSPGQAGAIQAAMLAVASGLCRHVLCFHTSWETSHAQLVKDGRWDSPPTRATGFFEERAPYGALSAASWIGIQASNYFHRYGTDRSTLGWIAVTERTHAGLNPEAVYRDPITMDDYLSARMISTPFGLYDCDVPMDGAVAIIVSAVETVPDRPRPSVFVDAVGSQIVERLSWDQGTLGREPQTIGPSQHLWSRSDLRQDDVDVALLYDGFSFNALSWLESLGFCEPGGAVDFIDEGRGISLGGRLPLNPHGGQLSAGRLHGFGFVREAILQLRGDTGARQVADARVAVVTTGGGAPGGAMLLRAE